MKSEEFASAIHQTHKFTHIINIINWSSDA